MFLTLRVYILHITAITNVQPLKSSVLLAFKKYLKSRHFQPLTALKVAC